MSNANLWKCISVLGASTMPEDKEATTSTSAFVWLRVRSASLLRLRMSDTTRAIRSSTSGGNFGQMLQSRVQSIAVMIFWQAGHVQDRYSRECLKRSGAEKCTVVYARQNSRNVQCSQSHRRLAEKNGQDRLKFAVDHLVLTQCSRRHSCQLLKLKAKGESFQLAAWRGVKDLSALTSCCRSVMTSVTQDLSYSFQPWLGGQTHSNQ